MSAATALEPARGRTPARQDRVRALALVGAMVVLMWVVEVLDAAGGHLDRNGIHPRDVDTLPDIAFAPFLHAGWGHLIGNTIPFFVLGATIALGGGARTAAAGVPDALSAVGGPCLLGRPGTNLIGPSGLVFGFAAYLVARG